MRVGLLGIYHESNTFIDTNTTMQNFKEGHLFYGEHIISGYQDAFHEIGGIIETLSQYDVQVVPIMYAEATPGGIIDLSTSQTLLSILMQELESALPLDGLMVVPHGAAVSEMDDDFDGLWLGLLRERLGSVPIVGTLDPHANVSWKMTEVVDAFVAYKTNPHIDQREVGRKAAHIMVDTLFGTIRPTQKLLPSKVAISIEQQNTSTDPCLGLYQLAAELSQKKGVISISILLGFPYADVKEMGSAVLVVTDNGPDLAVEVSQEIAAYLESRHRTFLGEKISVGEAIGVISKSAKPVLLLDMGDNVGGGASGDSTVLLHALEKYKSFKSFICINDPEAVSVLESLAPNGYVEISIGSKANQESGQPFKANVRLKQLVDGKFTETEPRHGGQVFFDMGNTAIVETSNKTTIMVTSQRTVPFSLEQLLHFGIAPKDFDVIVAKGVHAPVAAYGPVCPTVIRVNTPGVTTADMRGLTYKKRKVPLYPFEEIN